LMPPDALILAQNAPKCVWRPGSARTRWGSAQAPPDPLAAKRGPTSKGREGRGGEGWERRGREGKEREGKGEGKGSPLPRNPRSATGKDCRRVTFIGVLNLINGFCKPNLLRDIEGISLLASI